MVKLIDKKVIKKALKEAKAEEKLKIPTPKELKEEDKLFKKYAKKLLGFGWIKRDKKYDKHKK